MTQAQYQWLKNNGYDPTVYDVDDQGNIFENPVQKPEVMSPLRAGLTSFAGSVLPSAAGLGSAKLGMMAGAPFGPVGVGLGAIGGGLAGGYLAGKGQEAVLENYAPEAIAEMQRAQTDQPVASYVGGFAPSALAFRPSLQGMSSLLRPTAGGAATMREALTRPEFLAPAMNVAANVAGSTAGQLVNMSEGGEFSGPRFAADVALGTLFNKPTRLGRAMGFQDTPENVRLPDPDLAEARARKQTIPTETAEVLSPESVGVGQQRRTLNAPRFDESGRLLNQPFADVEIDISPEGVGRQPGALERPFIEAESAQRQLPNEGRKQLGYDPEQREAFIADKADESLENAFKQLEGPAEDRPAASALTEDAKAAQDLLNEAKQTGNQENIAAAQEIYDDISKRFSRAGEEASNSITQEDINRANEIANRRGLKIELERTFADDGQEVRGMFLVDKKTGDRVIRINPFMATADTAIHEIGHDVFRGVTSKGMRRSLMDTAIDSPAFKSELAARQDEVRAGRLSEQQARDIALEEGLIQAFGERLPNVSRSELRQWFAAFKANIKRITTGKMSPEDALAWMHYASTEAVPWKGVAVGKPGEERMQRGPELFGLTNEDFAPSNDPKFLHATHLEQNNPTGLRVAVRESSGKVTVGKLGELHMDLPAVTENSEFGFVDKAGNFLTREQASAQRANPDIRYQRGIGSEIKTPAELDYLASKGGPFADVATNVKAAYNTRDFKQGQWSSKYSLTTALPEEARVRLLNHLAGEFDSGIRSTPASDIRAAYDQLRNEYLPAIVNDYNAQGFTVRDTAGQRARGTNPTYFPLHAVADEVTNILTTKQGSPEWDKLKADFLNWNTQLRQADGASLAEAQRYADEKFQERVGITSKPPGIESGIPFSGARKPEGYPLPPSWRSNDIIDILNNYTRRSATDFAYQQHVESSPVAMAALGAKTMVNNQPIPANVLQSTPLIINEPSVQSVLREYRGTPAQRTEGALQSFGRFVSAATIGPVSKVGDIGTSMFKGLAYLQGSEYAAGLADFTKRIGDWAALKERSYASGLNKRDAAENMRQVLGIAEDSTAFMDKAARVLSKATFVNDIESAARVIAQGWGETIVGINKKLALGGDKNATQMLDTLSPDWRTRSDADLAAQVGRLLQGSYDMRQLPASVLEGAAAPYLTWSKWSIGQYDSFMKYALQPAMQGNMKPLIGQMLIGVLGGGAISAVQEWLNNREGKDITWKELESWMQQNQGELGADGGQLLGQKLLSMAQKMGTFGFAGDLVKMTIDAYAGGASQGVATMPAIDAIYDVSKRAAAAGKALDDGEDFGLVLKALLQDSLTGHVQALRVARNWLDEDENLRYDDRRKRRLFDELSGLPSKGGTFAVNYSNLSERDFERGEITEKTGEEAFELVSRAREEATSREDYASRIRKYKTSQNQIMPSMERQPEKAARYLSFVEGAEEGAGAETMRRYMTREYENKYRKSLIEGMSGLR